MARAPMQVLVYPYRFTNDGGIEYAIFYRLTQIYGDFWQAISGGGEDDETPLQTAKREAFEEALIPPDSEYMPLESMAMLPAIAATNKFFWGEDVLVIPEYCFGVHLDDHEIETSHEHEEFRWVDYDSAHEMLRWDSNKNAIWELNIRLGRMQR